MQILLKIFVKQTALKEFIIFIVLKTLGDIFTYFIPEQYINGAISNVID